MYGNKFYKGKYIVKNIDKYLGNKMPTFRSSWEKKFMIYLDSNTNILKWGSEILKIPYTYQLDNKQHNYYTDFYVILKDVTGTIQKYVIEIKPFSQLSKPKKPKINNKKSMQSYNYKMKTYIKNQNKWKTAIAYCNSKGLKFKILTEHELKI